MGQPLSMDLRTRLLAAIDAGYVQHHAREVTFSITPEQALVFTREGQPPCMQ